MVIEDDRICDHSLGITKDRESCGEPVRVEELTVAGQSTDADLGRLDTYVPQFVVQVVDIDEVLEIGQPELHHGQQTVPTSHEARAAAQPLKETDGVVYARGPLVLERCRNLHAQSSLLGEPGRCVSELWGLALGLGLGCAQYVSGAA